jgi:alanine racemase
VSIDRLGLKWVEVDLGVYESNLKLMLTYSEATAIIPVIKADAYGHGASFLARVCEQMQLSMVAVATMDEAISLRRQFIRIPILVMGALPPSAISDLLTYRITPTLCDREFAQNLNRQSRQMGRKTMFHLYVDSGMGRMGQSPEQLLTWMEELKSLEHILCEGIYSHFAVSDEIDEASLLYTQRQTENLLNFVAQAQLNAPLHMANSGAVIAHPKSHFQAIRPGLLSYGISPRSDHRNIEGVRPIMRLCCKPLIIKTMKAGDSVGYGRSFILERDAKVMTLPVGYADGIPRNLGPQLKVAYLNKLYPVVGRICMDMMMVLIGEDEIPNDAEIVLMGEGAMSIEEWSLHSGRIPYELLTGLGKRWSRCYVKEKQVVDIVRPE